jgi:hypothetical protein
MKNVPPSSSIERRQKHRNQPVMHSLQQTKKKTVREIMSIVIESCRTQSHGPSNMNDEIQKVDKLNLT